LRTQVLGPYHEDHEVNATALENEDKAMLSVFIDQLPTKVVNKATLSSKTSYLKEYLKCNI
jgi:hypothetical protein